MVGRQTAGWVWRREPRREENEEKYPKEIRGSFKKKSEITRIEVIGSFGSSVLLLLDLIKGNSALTKEEVKNR